MELLIRGDLIYFTEEKGFRPGWILVRDGLITGTGKGNADSAVPACADVLDAGGSMSSRVWWMYTRTEESVLILRRPLWRKCSACGALTRWTV